MKLLHLTSLFAALQESGQVIYGKLIVNDTIQRYAQVDSVYRTGHVMFSVLDEDTREVTSCLLVSPCLIGEFTISSDLTFETLAIRHRDIFVADYEKLLDLPDPERLEIPNL